MKYFTAQQYESNILLHFIVLLLSFDITDSDIHSSSIHRTHYCTSIAIAITWKCQTVMLYIQCLSCVMITNIHTVLSKPRCKTYTMDSMTTFHWHVQNATIPCHSQELLPFIPVMYFFLPPFSTNYSSILSHLILPSISSQSCSQIHI